MRLAIRTVVALGLALVLFVGCKKDTDNASAAAKPSYFSEDRKTTTATVQSVDPATREITIKNQEGEIWTLAAGPEVKNFAQIKPGDRIEAEYYESMAINVNPADKPADVTNSVEQAAERTAPIGEKPAGKGTRKITLVARIEKIDTKQQLVTLRGESGAVRTIKVRDPKKLENLKVGDQVVATYTEALAVAVKEVK